MSAVIDIFLLCCIWIIAVFLLFLFGVSLKKVCQLRKRDKEMMQRELNNEPNTVTQSTMSNMTTSIPNSQNELTSTPQNENENENENDEADDMNTQISLNNNSSSAAITEDEMLNDGQTATIPHEENDDDQILQPTQGGAIATNEIEISTPVPSKNDQTVQPDLSRSIQISVNTNASATETNVSILDNVNVKPFFRRAITCSIACFALSSLFAAIAIQLEVVHQLKPYHTMHQVSMVLMNVGRRLMFMMFIGRLYYTFQDTDFLYSMGVFKCLGWSFILEWGYFFAVCGTLFAIYGFLPSANPTFALPVSGIAMIWDLANFLVVARLFARNLWTLFYHTLQDTVDGNEVDLHEKDLIYLVVKYRILVFWAVATSIIVIMVLLIQISTEDYILSLFIIVVFHNLINAVCLYANYEFSHDLYDRMFHCCHNSCARFGIWKAVRSNAHVDETKVTVGQVDDIILRTPTPRANDDKEVDFFPETEKPPSNLR